MSKKPVTPFNGEAGFFVLSEGEIKKFLLSEEGGPLIQCRSGRQDVYCIVMGC